VNPLWSSSQMQTHVHFCTPGAFSDHSLASIKIGLRPLLGKRNFKFLNMWVAHPNFTELITNNWETEVPGSRMCILCKRLKFLKKHLRELNKLH